MDFTYCAAGSQLYPYHEHHIAQQEREGQVEVDKVVDCIEQLLSVGILKCVHIYYNNYTTLNNIPH